jgi:hypothetical protein
MKKEANFVLPKQGFVFWPVGTGDSTTICVTEEAVVQVDLHHLACSESADDPRIPIVNPLVASLPTVGDKPYLAVFVLTHPDEDHCLGFRELLKNVRIGELWFSPRIFREFKKDLCDDAKAFLKEATRRVKKTIEHQGDVASGDVVRIIGYDELLQEEEFKGFPKTRLSIPGHSVVELDGFDYSEHFCAFLHAPFKSEADGERNDCSIAMQVALKNAKAAGYALLLGDHCYPTLKRIFEKSDDENLKWHVLLGPHHCSKSAMYWKNEGAEEESLQQDIMDAMEAAAQSPGYIVISSDPIPASNEDGDCPPHAIAKNRYEEIAPDGLICTQEHGDEENPDPVVFELTDDGLTYLGIASKKAASKSISAAVAGARGHNEPPRDRVGFGVR